MSFHVARIFHALAPMVLVAATLAMVDVGLYKHH